MSKKATPEEPEIVKLKISKCQKCEGIVSAAVEHKMDIKMKNKFAKEVLKYDLKVETVELEEYRNQEQKWCNCETKQNTSV